MAAHRFGSSEDIFRYLMGFVNVERGQSTEFKLDRMLYCAERLGNPHLGRLTIHVAGSKGKGSVSTMCANMLAESGHATGLYTSPHLLAWKERIALAQGEMPEEVLLDAMDELFPLIDGKSPADFPGNGLPTFFELTTLIGFCAFRRAGCTAQVIETGLGGRLDSTNIVEPDVAVITPIELEHTQYLGDTLEKIAGEKAGIIKPGRPVCIAPQKPEAFAVFEKTARDRGCLFLPVEKICSIGSVEIGRNGTSCEIAILPDAAPALPAWLREAALRCRNPMPGNIQAQNMALALLATAVAAPRTDAASALRGLSAARLPARFEILGSHPEVVLDGAHTPESVSHGLDTFNSIFRGRNVLLFACAHDKKHEAMAKLLAPHFRHIVVTTPGTFKQSDPEKVHQSFLAYSPDAELVPDTTRAIERALELAGREAAETGSAETGSAEPGALLVTGSFYLCSEARIMLRDRGY